MYAICLSSSTIKCAINANREADSLIPDNKVHSKMIRRFPVAIQLSLLVVAWLNSHVIAGLTVDEQLEQLRINYVSDNDLNYT